MPSSPYEQGPVNAPALRDAQLHEYRHRRQGCYHPRDLAGEEARLNGRMFEGEVRRCRSWSGEVRGSKWRNEEVAVR